MQLPSWAVVTAAVLAAFPFGWGLGVVGAYLLAGPDFGQLPALTVPVGIIAAIIFALLPLLTARKRLLIMVAGTGLFILLGSNPPSASVGRNQRLFAFGTLAACAGNQQPGFLLWLYPCRLAGSSREDIEPEDSEQIRQSYELSTA